jgi:hypothetical protein
MERVGAKMRKSDHETRFCGGAGGGLRRRIYSRLCPWRRWTWWRLCPPIWSWRLRAQSYDSSRIAGTADARLPKPDSGPACGTCAGARHQRAVGAEPIWRGHVARLASFGVVRGHLANSRECRCFLLRRVRVRNLGVQARKREKEAARSRDCFSEVMNTSTSDITRFR